MHWKPKRVFKDGFFLNLFTVTGSDIVPSRCAPGYYGNPMMIGNSCKRCDCNGNSDPNLIFNECHNVTGHCQHCWGNTGGANCERCATGFYGDAISAKNCRGGGNEWTPTNLSFIQEISDPCSKNVRKSFHAQRFSLEWRYCCCLTFCDPWTILLVHLMPATKPDV